MPNGCFEIYRCVCTYILVARRQTLSAIDIMELSFFLFCFVSFLHDFNRRKHTTHIHTIFTKNRKQKYHTEPKQTKKKKKMGRTEAKEPKIVEYVKRKDISTLQCLYLIVSKRVNPARDRNVCTRHR